MNSIQKISGGHAPGATDHLLDEDVAATKTVFKNGASTLAPQRSGRIQKWGSRGNVFIERKIDPLNLPDFEFTGESRCYHQTHAGQAALPAMLSII